MYIKLKLKVKTMSTNTAQDDIFQVLDKLIESGKYDQVAKELESIAPFPAHMNCNDSKINTPITTFFTSITPLHY